MCSNGLPFVWRGIHDKCFKMIKTIASKNLSLRPIDRTSPNPVWVVCDACPSGCGTYYGQGEDWTTMHPAGFMSKIFSDAQRSYFTYEHEMRLALLRCSRSGMTPSLGLKRFG